MRQVIRVLALLMITGLLGGTRDLPHPYPLVTEAEARSFFPELRLPAYLPEREERHAFTLRLLQSQPIVTLHYNYTPDGRLWKWFQIHEGPPTVQDALHPRPIIEMPPRISLGLVETVPKEIGSVLTVEPREEIREGYILSVVSGTRCLDALCEERELYTQAMTCNKELCAQIEGPLEEETAVQVLLSLFSQ